MAKMKTDTWINVPPREVGAWFGEWLLASFVVNAYTAKRGLPKKIRLRNDCVRKRKDGGADIRYEVSW